MSIPLGLAPFMGGPTPLKPLRGIPPGCGLDRSCEKRGGHSTDMQVLSSSEDALEQTPLWCCQGDVP